MSSAAVPAQTLRADRDSRNAAQVLGLCLPSDVLLYLLLPMYASDFGVTLVEAGVLLAANRLVRIIGYGWVVRFYARHGDRAACSLAAFAAAVCALGNATLGGFAALLVLRLVWGLCFATFNLSTQTLATAEAQGAARRAGRSRATLAIGPMLALPLGALMAQAYGPRAVFYVLCISALCGLWRARALPCGGHDIAARSGRRLRLPDSIATWSFIEGVTLDGLFIFGLSLYAQVHMGESGVLVAGVLMAVRYLSEMLFSPFGGRLADRFGALRMLVVLSLTTSLALLVFASHWLFIGAFFVLVLRALQLPLVMTLVALRNPHARIQALASNAVWRDIGAGLGPMLAGVLLPQVPAIWAYAGAALAVAVAALNCARPPRH
ncbi:MFS transporter [Pseudomonas putida]|uniref:MFS transporter n=1 Tax=Pseudomonas putida TaxID=303 RepID=UPI000818F227|nr:MFS transporter [Pseudomonas putida]OCT25298.1 MFS transporter [Pseudomonas putida]OCT26677.1 MFS transporter [Pseudomonas putida]OCT32653.1 MFS transporter [Pseudomonas putida]OCT40663.1 MFS transporter [Pseudomonas putida]